MIGAPLPERAVILGFDGDGLDPCGLVWSRPIDPAEAIVEAPEGLQLAVVGAATHGPLRAARVDEPAMELSFLGTLELDPLTDRARLTARPELAPPRLTTGAIEPGSACTPCGAGAVDALKACDDGGLVDGDGCDARCAIEPGFRCSGAPSVCEAVCGDRIRVKDEGCDDGNDSPGDGCHACVLEPGWACHLGGVCRRAELGVGATRVCRIAGTASIACTGGAPPPEGRFVAIDAEDDHACAVGEGGVATCWGAAATAPIEPVSALSVARDHACAIIDGRSRCWGPSALAPAATAQIAAGEREDCALDALGRLRTTLGDPPLEGRFVQIALGDEHGCGLRADGQVDCWGLELDGRTRPPEQRFRWIAAGGEGTCGETLLGEVECWGSTLTDPPRGVALRSFAVGGARACGIDEAGALRCWPE